MTKEVPRTYVIRDEELIAYLRLQGLDKDIAAADRIEALIAERDAAEAKLAKAVKCLTHYATCPIEEIRQDARTTLAEIKGENHE